MVNYGPSKGCNTCRKRRIKCDEGKPSCQRCLRRGLECGGYERRAPSKLVKFKVVESTSYARQRPAPGPQTGNDDLIIARKQPSSIRYLASDEQDAALGFFISHIATLGRDLESTRGFFEVLTPVLAPEDRGSPMYLATAATSLGLFNFWRKFSWGDMPRKMHGQAMKSLQAAIEDPVESKRDATIWAALILQFYDNLVSVNRLRKVPRTHHEGAIALIRHRGPSIRDTPYGKYLLCYVLHTEVSSAIRNKRPLPASSLSWLDYGSLPWNISSMLDIIGVSVANLQHKFLQLTPESLFDVREDIKHVSNRLRDWSQIVPTRWLPSHLQRVEDHTPPIITYSGTCDIYPSVTIASIWSIWRSYRLIVLGTSLVMCHAQQGDPASGHARGVYLSEEDAGEDSHSLKEAVQQLVDAVCATVPFFLGNLSGYSTFSDLTNSSIAFPGYHNFDATELPPLIKDGGFMSRDEHIRHAIVQGPWHIMSHLSHVLSLCSGPHGHVFAQCLRPGQLGWIREQVARIGIFLRLNLSRVFGNAGGFSNTDPRGPDETDSLVQGMRDGLRMTSGS